MLYCLYSGTRSKCHPPATAQKTGSDAEPPRKKTGRLTTRKVKMDLKSIFADKALTYDELDKALKEKGVKLADLATGEYVSKEKLERIEGDYKKQLADKTKELDEAKTKALEEYKAKGENVDKLQAAIDKLMKEKAELESKQQEAAGQLDRFSKRELASSKTGIHDPDFLDLMQARFGSQELSEFEKSVVAYAEGNKAKWGLSKPSADLNGEPKAQNDPDSKLTEMVRQAAGAVYKDEK